MGAFKYIRQNERLINKSKERKAEIIQQVTKEPILVRVDRPTKIARARMLGYKSKNGFVVVRVRVSKGSFRRPRINHARKPSKTGMYLNLSKSKRIIAEERASRVYRNMSLVGSYFLTENGQYKWFEVLMKDPIIVK